MSNEIVQLNEQIIRTELKELVRQSVEEVLNGLLDAEADLLTNARNMSARRQKRHRAGHYPQVVDQCWRSGSGNTQITHLDI